jgi:Holliday junction DNA helicase RuvB
VRDYTLVARKTTVELADVQKALQLMDIDELGLDSMDRKILQVMKQYYSGGPVGIEALSATLGEDKQTIEEVYEPYLLKQGLILRTPRGRVLSEEATRHLESR